MAIEITSKTSILIEDEYDNEMEIRHDEAIDNRMFTMVFDDKEAVFCADVIDDLISGLKVIKQQVDGMAE